MASNDKALQETMAPPAFASPRVEQFVFAFGGYLATQLLVLLVVSDADDGDYLTFGIIGAVIGIVLHVLVRGVGVELPGIGSHIGRRISAGNEPTAGSEKSSRRERAAARYRKALKAFRKAFESKPDKSEAPDNEEKIVETDKGFQVGERVFERRSDAEDYLYVGSVERVSRRKRAAKASVELTHLQHLFKPKSRNSTVVVIAIIIFLIALALS